MEWGWGWVEGGVQHRVSYGHREKKHAALACVFQPFRLGGLWLMLPHGQMSQSSCF